MRSFTTCLVALLCGLVLVAPLTGCGGGGKKKKGAMTIAERLKKARADTTPGGSTRELTKVARMQVKSGDKTGAVKTLEEARKTVAADADAIVFAPRLVEIAEVYGEVGEKKPGREAADKAVAMAESMSDAVSRVEVLSKAGTVYGSRLGDAGKARQNLAKAGEIAMSEDVSDRFRPQALAAVALGYANANLANDAKVVIAKLEEMAGSIEELRPKAEALAAAANVHARSGDKDKAAELLADAAKAAKSIDGAANKTYALIAVANAMVAAGDTKGATSLAAEAEKTSAKIADPEQQKEAVQDVRALQASVGKG
jgi:hypothetical protein